MADEAAAGAVAALDRRVDVVEVDAVPGGADLTAVVVAEQDASAALTALNADPRVEYAERDAVLSIAELAVADRQDWWPAKTGVDQVWRRTAGTSAPVIAVIDTGVDRTHPDLNGVAFLAGHDTHNGDADPSDDNGHGTQVIGTVAAQHNDVGGSGVCPRCTIMPLKALGADGKGYGSRIAAAVDIAVNNGAHIINMSLGGAATDGQEFSQALRESVARAVAAGVLVVAAAGNQGVTTPTYPAGYDGVVAVAGSDRLDGRYYWSNYGTWVDVAAPGCVYTTTLGSGYRNGCGTSFAAPVVAGTAGLLKTVEPGAGAAALTTALTTTGVAVDYATNGRLDASAAFDTLDDAPAVAFTAPGDAAWVGVSVPVTVEATDDLAVTKVDFAVNDVALASVSGVTTASHATTWDATTLVEGPHTLSATATDNSARTSTVTRTVTVDRTAPTVAVDAAAATTLTGITTLSATAADDVTVLPEAAVATVTFAVDGNVVGSDTTAPYSLGLDTTQLTNAEHQLAVTATDRAGNTATDTRAFTVANVATPTVEDDAPAPSTGGGGSGGGGGGGGGGGFVEPPPSPTPDPTPSPEPVRSFTDAVAVEAAGGDTVTTDSVDAPATAERPLQVRVTTPVDGEVTIRRSLAPTTAQPVGYQLLALETAIQGPAASAADPLLLTFRMHASALPVGRDADDLVVLRDGAVVEPCAGAGATPDPCLAEATSIADEVLLSVRTSRA
ncbi:MAG TPA: S8 family serine peptidase, partial [Cryptosporangiaceae bacterium]|nr:S8 family serine peptidase [Cryptosporangiaceae bacterium]